MEEAQIEHDIGVKHWQHAAETINILTEDKEETTSIQIFTDRSKTEKGIGAGTAHLNQATTLKVSNAG